MAADNAPQFFETLYQRALGRLVGGLELLHPAQLHQLLEVADDVQIIGEASNGIECTKMLAKLKPDILLLDEAIGAGDAHFIDKATKRAKELYERANIIIMASHDPVILQHLCNKALWIDQGQIRKAGPVSEVVDAYIKATV